MKKVSVKSLPINEVIRDLAKEFGVNHSSECDEYRLNLPEELGDGEISGVMFDSGLGMINYEVSFKERTQIHFTLNGVHPVKAIFCYEGTLTHCFANDKGSKHTINKYQNALLASEDTGGHILSFPKGVTVKFNSIEINREPFRERFSCPITALSGDMTELLNDTQARKQFYYLGDYSLHIAQIIADIRSYRSNPFLRRLFLEAKGYDLLVQQLAQYIDDKKSNGHKEILRGSDIMLVKEIATYLMDNIKQYITIPELSRKFGLNERKLQQGFQHLYGKTVNNFIQDYRVETASKLLLGTDMNISEILREIGITNSSYFAKIFKQRYGISPKAFQMKLVKKQH